MRIVTVLNQLTKLLEMPSLHGRDHKKR